jgi:transposase-like protein
VGFGGQNSVVDYLCGLPQKIAIDKCAANTAAIKDVNHDVCSGIEPRQSKYLNNIDEQATQLPQHPKPFH